MRDACYSGSKGVEDRGDRCTFSFVECVDPLAPLHFAFFHAGARGQTLGKRAAHIAVKDEETLGRLSLGRALGRAYLTAVFWYALYVGAFVDGLWALWDPKNQALHDKAVGSIVVKGHVLVPTAFDNDQRSLASADTSCETLSPGRERSRNYADRLTDRGEGGIECTQSWLAARFTISRKQGAS
jgi:hypothetical protein